MDYDKSHLTRKLDIDMLADELGLEYQDNFEQVEWFKTREKLIESKGIECCKSGLILRNECKFGWLKEIESFPDFLQMHSPSQRLFNEIIPLDRPHKVYFDLDLKVPLDVALKCLYELHYVALKMFQETYKVTPVILTYHSKSNIKYSYHVVLDGYLLGNYGETFSFVKKCAERLSFEIDMQVYAPWQSFRTVYSCKKGKDNPFIPFDKQTFDRHLLHGLVTFTGGCFLLSPLVTKQIKTLSNYKDYNEETQIILDDFLQDFIHSKHLSVIKIQSPFIVLKNNGGFYCEKCKEIHHNVNPYIQVTSSAYLFSCRQNKPVCIKNLATITAEFD